MRHIPGLGSGAPILDSASRPVEFVAVSALIFGSLWYVFTGQDKKAAVFGAAMGATYGLYELKKGKSE